MGCCMFLNLDLIEGKKKAFVIETTKKILKKLSEKKSLKE